MQTISPEAFSHKPVARRRKNYQCDSCGSSFKEPKLLYQHAKQTGHGQKKLKKLTQSTSMPAMAEGIKTTGGQESFPARQSFECRQCCRSFDNRKNLHLHVKRERHYQGEASDESSASTPSAHEEAKSISTAETQKHHTESSLSPATFSCKACSGQFSNRKKLFQHLQKTGHFVNKTQDVPETLLDCEGEIKRLEKGHQELVSQYEEVFGEMESQIREEIARDNAEYGAIDPQSSVMRSQLSSLNDMIRSGQTQNRCVPSAAQISDTIDESWALFKQNEQFIDDFLKRQDQERDEARKLLAEVQEYEERLLMEQHMDVSASSEGSNLPEACWDFQSEVMLLNFSSQITIEGDNAEEPCSICFENFTKGDLATQLDRCMHFFHKACIEKWFSKGKTNHCPLCKQSCEDEENEK